MNTFIITFENGDFLTTKINADMETAKQYYIGNYFNHNEKMVKAISVYNFDPFKIEVLQFCLNNKNVVLKFDDEKQEMYFRTLYNDFVNVSYEQVKNAMYSNDIDKYNNDTLSFIQLSSLNSRLTNYNTYPIAILKNKDTVYLLCKNQKFKNDNYIFTWSYNSVGNEKARYNDYVKYINSDYEVLKMYDQKAFDDVLSLV